ncbi:hypothetical protein NKH36_18465 [Mesorhizobium sp. M1312]|uniref:hypothetical protein n=1 Tax=unclassified Mesorhizobium TaxID=325217 RepID=UPI00333B4CCD
MKAFSKRLAVLVAMAPFLALNTLAIPAVSQALATEISEAMSVCNAGMSDISSQSLSDVEDALSGAKTLTSEARNEIRGLFLNGAKVSESQALELYREYVRCLSKYVPTTEQCLSRCEGRFVAGGAAIDRRMKACMADARRHCMDECIDRWNHDPTQCVRSYCHPKNPVNAALWVPKCNDRLEGTRARLEDQNASCLRSCE